MALPGIMATRIASTRNRIGPGPSQSNPSGAASPTASRRRPAKTIVVAIRFGFWAPSGAMRVSGRVRWLCGMAIAPATAEIASPVIITMFPTTRPVFGLDRFSCRFPPARPPTVIHRDNAIAAYGAQLDRRFSSTIAAAPST
ncbi:hypothetical protein [Amycolatopsis sp. CA-230715]|uniref:hypothetical protein n=1 Tax=Amycolatopsis sp. CA-230715 TaxID=2745196 RepID=UPI001C016C5C|nr:hypothetical protein [Amycolatopsis sp. CA-230715]QWF83856.1 hypothetical protein HUW46_07299 [Amycolatopsis sp. CA-230715]